MNGFAEHGLDTANFDEKGAGVLGSGLRTFDAFPKTKATYTTRHARGGQWTVAALLISALLAGAEVRRWARGTERRQFSVEPGIGDVMQVNVDVVMAMHCDDLHVNVQDAAGDLVLAGSVLQRDNTTWAQWRGAKGIHSLERHHRHHQSQSQHGDGEAHPHGGDAHHADSHGGEDHSHGDARIHHDAYGYGDDDFGDDYDGDEEEDSDEDYIEGMSALVGALEKKSFPKTPRLKRGVVADACRIYGSMELNKVQGDFHITARGHGYAEWGAEHLDHSAFNFSHIINELSFGPYYPSLHNPLDETAATTAAHFYKFQYYISIVPTVYYSTIGPAPAPDYHLSYSSPSSSSSSSSTSSPSFFSSLWPWSSSSSSSKSAQQQRQQQQQQQQRRRRRRPPPEMVFTNQYAVTEKSHLVGERSVPGVFFKYDIEPVMLLIERERAGVLRLLVRLVNVVSGALVAGAWCYQLAAAAAGDDDDDGDGLHIIADMKSGGGGIGGGQGIGAWLATTLLGRLVARALGRGRGRRRRAGKEDGVLHGRSIN